MDTNTDRLTNQAETYAQAGDKFNAKSILIGIIHNDPKNPRAWFLLSEVLERREQIIYCLERVLQLQPDFAQARNALESLQEKTPLQAHIVEEGIIEGPKSTPAPSPIYRGSPLKPPVTPEVTGAINGAAASLTDAQPISQAAMPRQSSVPAVSSGKMKQSRKQSLITGLRKIKVSRRQSIMIGFIGACLFIAFAVMAVAIWLFLSSRSTPQLSRWVKAEDGASLQVPGGLQVEIPPGAMKADGWVKISQQRVKWPADQPGALFWEIEAGELMPGRSVKLVFSYARLDAGESLSTDDVSAFYLVGEDWQPLPGVLDPINRTLTVESTHFSLFAITINETLLANFSKFASFVETCARVKPVHKSWTELVNSIAEANGLSKTATSFTVKRFDHLNTFLVADAKSGVILVDEDWMKNQLPSLPSADHEALAGAMLSHELSHIKRDKSEPETLSEAVAEFGKDFPIIGITQDFYAYVLGIKFAMENNDCEQAINSFYNASLVISLHAPLQIKNSHYCASKQQLELNADTDGVIWAGKFYRDQERIALLMIHFLLSSNNPGGCFYPSNITRVEELIKTLSLGEVGGVYGKVVLWNSGQGSCKQASIQLDNFQNTQTDCDGRFLIAPMPAGKHTLKFYSRGYTDEERTVLIPLNDLVEIQKEIVLDSTPESHFPTSQPMIAFVGTDDNIWVLMQHSGKKIQVTPDGSSQSWYGFPKWSPSGDRLAFCRMISVDNSAQYSIYTSRPDGSDITLITDHGALLYDWTPDGVNITTNFPPHSPNLPGMTSNGNPSGLVNINVDTLQQTLVIPPFNSNPIAGPVWSPDGKWLLFNEVTYIEGSGNFASYNIEAQKSYQAFHGEIERAGLAGWSPDGTQLVFDERVYVPRPGIGLYLANPDGQSTRKIFSDPNRGAYVPRWSPDGKHIAFMLSKELGISASLMIMNADGSGAYPVLDEFEGDYVWSKAGNALLLNNNGEIMIYDLNTRAFNSVVRGATHLGIDWFTNASDKLSTPIKAILQQIQQGIDQGSPNLLSSLISEKVYLGPGCCSNFALSNQAWYPKLDALGKIDQLWSESKPTKCLGYQLTQKDGMHLYKRNLITALTVYLDNHQSLVFTDGLSIGPELSLTEYYFFPDDVEFPTDLISCQSP